MGLNEIPSANRTQIGFFGKRNSGKSSLVNAVTGQNLAVVSDVAGTTTDPVVKTMELLPIGPVVVIDTPGIDDIGTLGQMRVEKTYQIMDRTDIAVVVLSANRTPDKSEMELLSMLDKKNIPVVLAVNKCDVSGQEAVTEWEKFEPGRKRVFVSAKEGKNVRELKEEIGKLAGQGKQEKPLAADLVKAGDFVVLVTPIDSAAPKGRLILPQQQVIRDLLEGGAAAVVLRETELEGALQEMGKKPRLVITDSQAFAFVNQVVPSDIPLTSFSILFARYKGTLDDAVNGARMLDALEDGDKVLISEGCTHHRQCDDIGTVKLPAWLKKYTGKKLELTWTSGNEFPDDLRPYRLVIHCGGCMLNERQMQARKDRAAQQETAMTNYGIAIAYMNGILGRSLRPLGIRL